MIANSFTVKQGGTAVTRHNRINNVFRFYREGRVMCSYIYAKYDTNKYVYKTPTMISYNFDPSKGRMYVTYEATLAAEELGGKLIECVGFAASQSEALVVNYSDVSVKKRQGEPLLISGTLYLTMTGNNYGLIKGDNRLVRMMLGTELFVATGYRIAYSTTNTPFAAYEYEGTSSSVVTPTFSDTEIYWGYTIKLEITDAVILLDNKPVIREMPPLGLSYTVKSATAVRDDYTQVSASDTVVGLTNLEVNLNPVTDFAVRRMPNGLKFISDDKIKLPAGARIMRDTDSKYFAYVSPGKAAIFDLADAGLTVRKWVTAKDILPCGDGSYFVIRDGGLVSILKGDEEKALEFTAGEKYVASEKDGSYVFMTWKDGKVYVYTLSVKDAGLLSFTVTESSFASSTAAGEVHLFAMPNTVCAVCLNKQSLAFTPSGENTLKKNWLNSICDSSWFSNGIAPVFDNGRLLLYNSYYDITTYYMDMSSKLIAEAGYGRHYGDFCVRNTGIACNISLVGEAVTVMETVSESVTYAIIKDKFLYLFLASGKVKAYYIKSAASRIYSSKIITGLPIKFTVVSVVPYYAISRLYLRKT